MKKISSILILLILPLVYSSSSQQFNPFNQGNRKRVIPRVSYSHTQHGECSKYITNFETFVGGFMATIMVHDETSPAVDNWYANFELTKDVDRLSSYDAFSSSDSGRKFQASSNKWNAETEYGEIRNFTIHGKVNASESVPRIKTLSINGGPVMNCVFVNPTNIENDLGENTSPDEYIRIERQNSGLSLPKKVLGLYVLLADDDEDGYESDSDSWTPELFPWQQEAANVLFFTFIHPETMEIPPAFKKLADTRGTNQPGAVPADTVILFAIGGYAYSLKPNPWDWLTTKEKAEAMAEKVATWPDLYNCDGIDLDLEEGAGAKKEAGPNMIHFIKKLRQLKPNMIITQPTYGYPQVQAEIDVINAGFDAEGNNNGLIDGIGLMVYEGTQALNYVKNYANGAGQWEGFPVKIRAPKNTILLGAKGATPASAIATLAKKAVEEDLLGIMVWYASVKNGDKHGLQYHKSWDASLKEDSISAYKNAMQLFRNHL